MLLAGETAADVTAISQNGQRVMQAIEVSTIKYIHGIKIIDHRHSNYSKAFLNQSALRPWIRNVTKFLLQLDCMQIVCDKSVLFKWA